MKKILLICLTLMCSLLVKSEDGKTLMSTRIDSARYEIISNVAFYTLRLNKVTGEIKYCESNYVNLPVWKNVEVIGIEYYKEGNTDGVNYQIHTDFSLLDTYLLNIHNGQTWRIARDDKSWKLFFFPIRDF